MTNTTVINGQSFGTSTNVGDNLFAPAATTLASTTTAVNISVKIVLAANGKLWPNSLVRVFFATSPDTVTGAGDIPQQLGPAAYEPLERNLDRRTLFFSAEYEVVNGTKFYCWVSAPTLDAAATITVKLNEVP